MNKSNLILLDYYKRGYRVTFEGDVIGPKGNKLKLMSSSCSNGRPYFGNSRKGTVKVHRLQAYQKFGDKIFESGIEVRHLNNNKKDNSYSNIAIGTNIQNAFDMPAWFRCQRAITASTASIEKTRKLSEDQVRELRRDREDGFTYKQLMEKYNIAKSTVSYIVNRKTYKKEKFAREAKQE